MTLCCVRSRALPSPCAKLCFPASNLHQQLGEAAPSLLGLGRPCIKRRPTVKGLRDISVGTTTEINAPLEDRTTKDETYNWQKQWWPVQFTYNLATDRTNRIQLLGEFFVAWKSKNGEWVVMKDICPHRLAPLSEGRVEEDGTLMCSYHGWRFNDCGKCVKIPQADDEKSHEMACNNPRSAAQTYPCKDYASCLWIWPENSEAAFEEAETTPLPIPSDHAACVERIAASGLRPGYTRILPYSFDVLMENVVDPSHFPFSHHGTLFGTRDQAVPLKMRMAEPLFPESIASATYNSHTGRSPVQIEVKTPSSVWFQYGVFGEGDSWQRDMNFIIPVNKSQTRLLILGIFARSFAGKPAPFLAALPFRLVPWIFHLNVLPIVDGDNVFLHEQEQHLEAMSGTKWDPSVYFMPASSDLMVTAYRRWLATKGGGGPDVVGPKKKKLTRRELLDRYETHAAECKTCQEGIQFLHRARAVCSILSQATLAVAFCMAVQTLSGSLALWKTAIPMVLAGVSAFIERHIRGNVLPQFHFVDYIHAEKN